MQLSMWILADWLKKYDPEIKIEDGKCILRNVRLLTADLNISRTAVYLESVDRQRVMCFNGHDILVLNSDDINEVFNQILDAFDYYNEWDADMYDLVHSGCSLRTLLRAGNRILYCYLIFADATFYMRETEGPEEILNGNLLLKKAVEERLLPLDIRIRINQDSFIRIPRTWTYIENLPEIDIITFVNNIYTQSGHKGWLVSVPPDNHFSRGMFDLQEKLAEWLNLWAEIYVDQERKLEKAGLFTEIIDGMPVDRQQIQRQLEAFRWNKDDKKILYVIRALDNSMDFYYVLKGQINRMSNALFVIGYHQYLLCIVNLSLIPDISQFELRLKQILQTCGCRAGTSISFTDILQLKTHYIAAEYAVNACMEKEIMEFYAVAGNYMIHELQNRIDPILLHPAISILQKHDKRYGAQLNITLKIFLQSGCNYTETAKSLFIHRSTLVYRINKILELTEIDLNNFKERYYLETSYLLYEEKNKPSGSEEPYGSRR